MKDIQNRPRISRWIGRGYILLTFLLALLYISIAVSINVFGHPYGALILTAVMAFVIILLCAITYSFYKTRYVINNGVLHSWSPFAVINLRLADIKKIELTRLPFYFKGFGSSLYSGWFYTPAFGWTKVVMTNLTDGVLITDKEGKHYLITPSNPGNFIKSLR